VVAATNHHLELTNPPIEQGTGAHAKRRELLKEAGDEHILAEYLYLRDRLHGECFYGGECGPEPELRRRLHEAATYVTELTGCEVPGA
jgi:hypothetical protein